MQSTTAAVASAAAAVAAAPAVATIKSFWANRPLQRTAHEVKQQHMLERSKDKALRWKVRKAVGLDGVTSNLYPLRAATDAVLYRYELVVKKAAPAAAAPDTAPGTAAPVSPNRAWRMYAQALRKYPTLPPVVRVSEHVFAAAPLPEDILELPPEYHDLGWERCSLRFTGKEYLSQMTPGDAKTVLNKMLPWALSYHARRDGSFAVVREVDGKMVCTEDGIAVSGLRVFRGTTASVIEVTSSAAAQEMLTDPANKEDAPPSGDDPHTAPVPNATPLNAVDPTLGKDAPAVAVVVRSVNRSFEFKGRPVVTYIVEDHSGSMGLTLWGYPESTLTVGGRYRVTGLTCKAADPRYPRGSLQVELTGLATNNVGMDLLAEPKPGAVAPDGEDKALGQTVSTTVALRLDTRCTVAAEKSLWEEVRQHFGDAPFSEEKQRRITRALQGTPCILSMNLRHTAVRAVRFDFATPEDAPLDPSLRQLSAEMDPTQPYAVAHDFSVVPLQMLHCCFDPRMRSWQEITVPACSFMPSRRYDVLSKFRGALAEGMREWGVELRQEPYGTKLMTLLAPPEKAKAPAAKSAATPAQSAFRTTLGTRPRAVALVAITPPRATEQEREKCEKTAQAMGKAFRTTTLATVPKEQAALEFLDQTMFVGGRGSELKDRDAAVIIVTPDRDSRASWWLQAECLRRGIVPLVVRGTSGDKRMRLLAENVRFALQAKFAVDPVPGLSLGDIPPLQDRNTLVVGVDACHTHDITTGAVCGTLLGAQKYGGGARSITEFWRNEVRGKEVEQVADHFGACFRRAQAIAPEGRVDEVIVFQDGNVYSELEGMREKLSSGPGLHQANLSFLCLHKRTNVRFVHKDAQTQANVVKGAVVQELTPVAGAGDVPSFYLQSHDCFMSTARPVQYKAYCQSPAFPLPDIQRLAFVLAHAGAPMSTKLPLPTRCAHRLSATVERLVDGNPAFRAEHIPEPACYRMWYM